MSILNLLNQTKDQIALSRPFVIYSDFGKKNLNCLFQNNSKIYNTVNYTESGFILAPYNSTYLTYLIPKSDSDFYHYVFNSEIDIKNIIKCQKSDSKKHKELVNRCIDEILNSELDKVVVARDLKLKIKKIDVIKLFLSIVNKYSEAYNFCWYHPETGFWLGASPESLINLNGNNIKTISLAGTRLKDENIEIKWDTKNFEEQEIVTSYLKNTLKPHLTSYAVKGPKTIQAGNLLHLQTILTGKLKSNSNVLSNLISMLHPTPAVCGFPKQLAMDFIKRHELIDRKYYSGFLGIINQCKTSKIKYSNLVVNLRCMNIDSGVITLFAGGGITNKSDSEKEWEETELKINTLKTLL